MKYETKIKKEPILNLGSYNLYLNQPKKVFVQRNDFFFLGEFTFPEQLMII